MAAVLEPYLALLERHPEVSGNGVDIDPVEDVTDAIEMQLAVFAALERRIGPLGLAEQHRRLVPLFTRWLHSARELLKTAVALKKAGARTPIDDLAFTINRAKLVTEDFDQIVALNLSQVPGQNGPYATLDEVKNGLRPAS